MIIRAAEKRDIPALARLLHQVNDVHAQGRPDIFILGQRKYTDDELLEVLSDASRPVFVAVTEQGVAGYAFCIIEIADRHNLQPEKALYIDDICVDEANRGSGIGKGLYDYVNQYAKDIGCRRITLNVWTLNSGAMEFYKKMGMDPLKITMEQIL